MLFGSTCVSLGSSLTSDLVSSRFGAAFFLLSALISWDQSQVGKLTFLLRSCWPVYLLSLEERVFKFFADVVARELVCGALKGNQDMHFRALSPYCDRVECI